MQIVAALARSPGLLQGVTGRFHELHSTFLCAPAAQAPSLIGGRAQTEIMALAETPRRKKKADLLYLKSLPSHQPDTDTGQVLWMWPEIQAALAAGRTVKEIWEAARQDGVDIAYPQFRVYVWRLRRWQNARSAGHPTDSRHHDLPQPTEKATPTPGKPPIDPLYNIRVQLERKRQSNFEYNPFPDPKDSVT